MRTNAPRTRSRTRVCKNQKISLHFSRASSPHPSTERRTEGKEILGCAVGSVSKSSVRSLYSQTPLFPTSRRPEALTYTEQVVVLTCAHAAHTSHWPLTFVRGTCSVCARVRWVTSLEFVVSKVVCANAQANLYVLVPPSQYAHKPVRFAGGSLKLLLNSRSNEI